MPLMRIQFTILLIAFYVVSTGAAGQSVSETTAQPNPNCPAFASSQDMGQAHLLGQWQATIDGQASATMVLEKSVEYSEGISGNIRRAGRSALVAGDIEDGALQLEESEDGTHISATWTGSFKPDSCGLAIVGSWQSAVESTPRAFMLRKQVAQENAK